MSWEAVSAVASMLAAGFAFLAIRQANRFRDTEAESAAYSRVVLEPIQMAIDEFVGESESVLLAGQADVAQMVSSDMISQSQVDRRLRALSEEFIGVWIELNRVVRRSLVIWDEDTLRDDLRVRLQELQEFVLLEISKMAVSPEDVEFPPLVDKACASIGKRVWDGHPSLKRVRETGIARWLG